MRGRAHLRWGVSGAVVLLGEAWVFLTVRCFVLDLPPVETLERVFHLPRIFLCDFFCFCFFFFL